MINGRTLLPKRSTTYRYMHDMAHSKIRAYGDSEYGDVQDLDVPQGCMSGLFNQVCVISTEHGTWVVRHHATGAMYLEDAKGTDDADKVDVSPILTDTRQ